MAQAVVLKPGQYGRLLKITSGTSRVPERDVLVLLLGIHTGMRVSEIAQIGCRTSCSPPARYAPKCRSGRRSRRVCGSDASTRRTVIWSRHLSDTSPYKPVKTGRAITDFLFKIKDKDAKPKRQALTDQEIRKQLEARGQQRINDSAEEFRSTWFLTDRPKYKIPKVL